MIQKRLSVLLIALLTACTPVKRAVLPPDTPSSITAPASAETSAAQTIDKTIGQTPADKTANTSAAQSPVKQMAGAKSVPSSWELTGAIATRSKNKTWTASVNWLQRGAGSYQIRFLGPVGSKSVLIEKQGGNVTYREGNKTASSGNADVLLQQQTGIRLPVNNLYYWVRGIPGPGAVQSAKYDATHHLTVLQQAGFTIEYLGYKTAGNTILPSLIRLQGNGVFIKFVIKRWNV